MSTPEYRDFRQFSFGNTRPRKVLAYIITTSNFGIKIRIVIAGDTAASVRKF